MLSRYSPRSKWTPSGAFSTETCRRPVAPPTRSARRRPKQRQVTAEAQSAVGPVISGLGLSNAKTICRARFILRLGTQNGHGELNQRCPVAHRRRSKIAVLRFIDYLKGPDVSLGSGIARFCRLPMIHRQASGSPAAPRPVTRYPRSQRQSRSRTIDCTLRWVGRYPGFTALWSRPWLGPAAGILP